MNSTIIHGDSSIVLKNIESNSIDSIVTDPPYGIDFLDNEWDETTGPVEVWKECLRVLKPGGHLIAFSSARTYHRLATCLEDIGFEIRDQLLWLKATSPVKCVDLGKKHKELAGWRHSLKAGHEPMVLARKSFNGTLEQNMLTEGVGALNIDACRVPGEKRICPKVKNSKLTFGTGDTTAVYENVEWGDRFPMNVMGEVLDDELQRYYFCPRVTRKERGDNDHPTLKPINLMRYLVRLVCPKGGVVLDPFNGSGTTGVAAVMEEMSYIGVELDVNYVEISKQRIKELS